MYIVHCAMYIFSKHIYSGAHILKPQDFNQKFKRKLRKVFISQLQFFVSH